MSVTVVATIYPKPEHHAEVIAIFEGIVPIVHAEDVGCELYAMQIGADRLVMVEKWTTREDLSAHAANPALAAMRVQLEGKLAQPGDVQRLEPYPAGTVEQGTL
jgi:quinol monooxygenase YgiN